MPNINTKIHTFAQALWNKRNNVSLSPKTRLKLTEIANVEFGGSAKHIFNGKAGGVARFDGDGAGLRKAIAGGLMNVRSPVLRRTMSQWLERLPVSDPHPGHRFELKVTQRIATAPDRTSIVSAWLATSPNGGAAQRKELPAVEIPPEDYADDAPVVQLPEPEPDYDGAPEPELPPVDYEDAQVPGETEVVAARDKKDERHVHFSEVVEVVYLPPSTEQDARKGRSG